MKIIYPLLLFFFGLGMTSNLSAEANHINLEDHRAGTVTLAEAARNSPAMSKRMHRKYLREHRKQLRAQKRMEWLGRVLEKKLTKRLSKRAHKKQIGGFDDPVDKWFWFWVIVWGAAILFLILAGAIGNGLFFGFIGSLFGLVSVLLWIGGTILLIIWLINRFG